MVWHGKHTTYENADAWRAWGDGLWMFMALFYPQKKKDQTLQAAAGSFACFACPKILQDLGEPSGFTWKGRLLTKHLQEISME
jgi:hypothetical protein